MMHILQALAALFIICTTAASEFWMSHIILHVSYVRFLCLRRLAGTSGEPFLTSTSLSYWLHVMPEQPEQLSLQDGSFGRENASLHKAKHCKRSAS